MIRVLHISKYYYPFLGGIVNVCRQLVNGMAGCQSSVICFSESRKSVVEIVDGITVYRAASWCKVSSQAIAPGYYPMLRRALREQQPDIVHFHWANPFAAAPLLMLLPTATRLVVHWHMDIIRQSYLYPLIKPLESALLRRADRIIVTSPQYLEDSVPLRPYRDKAFVVPNAVDAASLELRDGDLDAIRSIRRRYDGRKIVLFVGRHIHYKGLPYLLEAERYVHSDSVFVIAGNGPLTEELRKQTDSKRVYFVGRISDDELRQYLHAASVFAFPSVTKNEAFGLALAEAMYCHTPAVTFTIHGSGVNWVSLNGVTGIEVTNRDANALAKALDTLLADDALRQRMGEAAHRRVSDNFTVQTMLHQMRLCYAELMQNEHPADGRT